MNLFRSREPGSDEIEDEAAEFFEIRGSESGLDNFFQEERAFVAGEEVVLKGLTEDLSKSINSHGGVPGRRCRDGSQGRRIEQRDRDMGRVFVRTFWMVP